MRGVVADLGADMDGSARGRLSRRGLIGAVPVDVQVGGRDKVDVAIDAAVEVVLACAGIQLCVPAIVQTDGNDVISRNQCIGDVDRKAGVATLVVNSSEVRRSA